MDQLLESLHVCYFHKPHMDQPLESLHVCVLFHKPHMDQPPESLHVCSYTKTNTRVYCMCVLSTNHTRINQWSLHVCCFPQNTHGTTSGHRMCVLSTNHIWINQSH